jgi:hypothetical protein
VQLFEITTRPVSWVVCKFTLLQRAKAISGAAHDSLMNWQGILGNVGASATYRFHHEIDAARIAVNYRFGGPVVAKY